MWGLASTIRRVAATPSRPGMPRSIRTTSGWRARAAHGLVAGLGLADERQVRLGSEQRRQARPEPGVVVGDQDPDRLVGHASAGGGGIEERQASDDPGPAARPRLDPALAAELGGPLVHRATSRRPPALRRQSSAVVLDDERQVGPADEAQRARRGAGMADGVGHRLRADPVGGDLDRRGQRGQAPVRRDVETRRAGRLEPVGGEPEGTRPARPRRSPAAGARRRGGERRRPRSRPRPGARRAAGPRVRVVAEQVLRGPGPHADRGQCRPEAVVEIPTEPPPLLLARRDDPLPDARGPR